MHHDEPPQTWHSWLSANARRFLLFARSQCRTEEDAQDVLQDALVESWRRTRDDEDGTDGPPPDALVFATIRRRAIDLARSNTRREKREHSAEWFQPPDEPGEPRDRELEEAVKRLPDDFREVLVLKVWGGLTFEKVAEALDIPMNTAASRYRYALNRLREDMKGATP